MQVHVVPRRGVLFDRGPAFRKRAITVAAVVTLVPVAITVLVPVTVEGAITAKWGYAYANRPSVASYIPDPSHQRQSNGRQVHITREAVGVYWVRFPGLLDRNAHVYQVTPFGADGASCQTDGEVGFNRTDAGVEVRCYGLDGSFEDSRFEVSFTSATGTGNIAYAEAAQNVNGGILTSFDGHGGTITSDHTGTGTYTVDFPNLDLRGGTVKVTSWASGQVICSVMGFGPAPLGGQHVNVACRDSTGHPADSLFTITFVQRTTLLGVPHGGGYVLDNAPTMSYVDSDVFSYNWTGRPIEIDHPSHGEYEVTFRGFGTVHGFAQVTASESTAINCELRGFGRTLAGAELVKVNCFDRRGRLADSGFTMQFAG